jgi:hypothetical protein
MLGDVTSTDEDDGAAMVIDSLSTPFVNVVVASRPLMILTSNESSVLAVSR